jgi:adenine-specific DNA glycosylase
VHAESSLVPDVSGGRAKAPAQKKREIHYALDCREGKVFLVQRAKDAALMAGMWELPEIGSRAKAPSNGAGVTAALQALRHPKAKLTATPKHGTASESPRRDHSRACYTLKHSITVTDYTVRVWRVDAPESASGKWIAVERLGRVALTGLARKILRNAKPI